MAAFALASVVAVVGLTGSGLLDRDVAETVDDLAQLAARRRPRTWVRITRAGQRALAVEMAALSAPVRDPRRARGLPWW